MKKVIVISTSLRHGSNSDMLADQFAEGAKAASPILMHHSSRHKNTIKTELFHQFYLFS